VGRTLLSAAFEFAFARVGRTLLSAAFEFAFDCVAGALPKQSTVDSVDRNSMSIHFTFPVQCDMPIPPEIRRQKYISLVSFRRTGSPVATPVWFGERDEKLYVMTRSDSGKYKRIRNNPRIRVAPCTVRGKLTGPEFEGMARVLPNERWDAARETIHRKYWLARIPFVWSKKNVYLEIEIQTPSPKEDRL
jgi:hypothetical protein